MLVFIPLYFSQDFLFMSHMSIIHNIKQAKAIFRVVRDIFNQFSQEYY